MTTAREPGTERISKRIGFFDIRLKGTHTMSLLDLPRKGSIATNRLGDIAALDTYQCPHHGEV
jgi:hypothetical protein